MSTLLLSARRKLAFLGAAPGGGPPQSLMYPLDDFTDFANPERGWYVENSSDYNFTSGENNPSPVNSVAPAPTLQMRYVRLDSYRTTMNIPTSALNTYRAEMAAWRSSGRKAILRYAYNRGSSTTNNDASLAITLNHISQLGELWQEYQDVIAVLQAGFIGRWGEWNSSSSGNLASSNRTQIIDALLAAAPAGMMIQLRKPVWHHDRWATVLPPNAAWSGTPQSRVGMMNDSFLAGTGHGGTFYTGDGMTFAEMRDYWEALSPFVAYGGESSDLGGLSESVNGGAAAIAEMEKYHLDYLNSEFWVPMHNSWASSGHLATISRRLGYRLGLTAATLPVSVSPGGSAEVVLNIQNSGFGKVYNPRPICLVLKATGKDNIVIPLTNDARSVLPSGGTSAVLSMTGTVPGAAVSGTYAAYLWLPDPSAALKNDYRYSIRLANTGMWENGMNNLNANILVASG